MLGRKNNAAFHFAFRRTGHHVHKVNHKLSMRVGDDGKVCIRSFRYFFRDLNIDLTLGLLILLHKQGLRAAKVGHPF
jgi:hypothetical protein